MRNDKEEKRGAFESALFRHLFARHCWKGALEKFSLWQVVKNRLYRRTLALPLSQTKLHEYPCIAKFSLKSDFTQLFWSVIVQLILMS